MAKKIDDINLRSEPVQDIMTRVPHWILRVGTSIVFGLVMILLVISFIVKYPDVIPANIKLTTINPPIRLIVKSSGTLRRINFVDGEEIKKGEVIATIDNSLSELSKLYLENVCFNVREAIASESLVGFSLPDTILTMGEIQSDYVALKSSITEYNLLFENNKFIVEMDYAKKQIQNHKQLKNILTSQATNSKLSLNRSYEKFKSDSLLFLDGVLSKLQYYEEEKKYISAKNDYQNIKLNDAQQAIAITELEREFNELSLELKRLKNDALVKVSDVVGTIEKEMIDWKRNYEIVAPIDGRIAYVGEVNQDQYVEGGKELFAIVPENQTIVGQMVIQKQGIGKVKCGQDVFIKLDAYPYHEFGQLKGKVSKISLMTKDGNYLAQVELINGLITTYNRTINYSPEMSGNAEIVTEDYRLIERVFNKIRKIFN